MTDWAARERAQLLERMAAAGPHGSTLLPGWTTHELAAHLLVRERHPAAVVGLVVAPLRGVTAALERRARSRPYEYLLAGLRAGPPLWSAGGALRGPAAGLTDLHEFFVHHEDVRRVGEPGPRDLPDAEQDALWSRVRVLGPALAARAGLGVSVRTPDGRSARLGPGRPEVVVVGVPGELLLWLFGRREVARVEVQGTPEALARAQTARLGW